MVGGRSIRPGDVIRHYGNKTSEVLNTDAEGRLILADALALASEGKPDAIVDAATLTGSISVALGKTTTGYFATDDGLADEIQAAADAAGERVWRMPLYDDFRPIMDSDIADIKNTGVRWGGSIYGATFLREFVGKGIPWAHLDIAGTARADNDRDEVTKGGSGVATRTMLTWTERRGS
jgi:leucyl aminopeptidase